MPEQTTKIPNHYEVLATIAECGRDVAIALWGVKRVRKVLAISQ